jgi:transketolase
VIFIGSDIAAGTLEKFRQEMPERYFMEGISEANIVGLAVGFALNGKIPFINTIDCFLIRRCLEQIVLGPCFHSLNVRLIGNGGGVVYAPLGATHWAIEDIAVLRAVPNMAVVAPADAEEMKRLMPATLEWHGPMFIRLAKGGDPIVTSADRPFRIGKAILMREGNDALIVSTGIVLKAALDAACELQKKGVEAAVLHVHTVKPIDREAILEHSREVRAIVTAEEHTIVGGLGGAVAEIIAEAAFSPGKKFARLGFPDVFPDGYGTQAQLMKRYGIDKDSIVEKVLGLCKE